jgi:hypothetical protein
MRTIRRPATIPVESSELPDEIDRAPADEAGAQGAPASDDEPDEARRRRIAERAYRRAEQRGFAPGQELDDWLAAEAEERDGGRSARREAGIP